MFKATHPPVGGIDLVLYFVAIRAGLLFASNARLQPFVFSLQIGNILSDDERGILCVST